MPIYITLFKSTSEGAKGLKESQRYIQEGESLIHKEVTHSHVNPIPFSEKCEFKKFLTSDGFFSADTIFTKSGFSLEPSDFKK